MKVVGVIPARYASTRFPGKALVALHGKPLIQHVVERVKGASRLDEVVVATDDERIAEAVQNLGVMTELTSADHPTGSDRVAEVVERHPDWDIVINIQGDEPYIDSGVINDLADALIDSPDFDVSTAMVRIRSQEDFLSPHVVKAIVGPEGRALYFTRSPAPSSARLEPTAFQDKDFIWGMKHLGIYGYRRDTLLQFTRLAQTPLENREKLEQLRLLENGVQIKVIEVQHDSIGVDTPEELRRLEKGSIPPA